MKTNQLSAMAALAAGWPQVHLFLQTVKNAGVDQVALEKAVAAGLVSVNSGYYSNPRMILSEKIVRFTETVLGICLSHDPDAFVAVRKAMAELSN